MHEHHGSTQTLRGGSRVKMARAAGGAVMMLPQAKECLGFQNWKKEGRILPGETPEQTTPCYTLIWRFFFLSPELWENTFFLEYFFFKLYICLHLIYNAVIVSSVQQSESVIHVSITFQICFLLGCSVQFSRSVVSLFNPMNRSTPGLPVHHKLLEFTQTHVHWVSDAIQPSHPLSFPSPPAPNPSQHQSLFQWISSSHEVAKVLEFQLQHHSLQRNPRADLQNGLVVSPCSPRDSQESSPTPQFKSINSSALSLLHSPTLTSIHDHS